MEMPEKIWIYRLKKGQARALAGLDRDTGLQPWTVETYATLSEDDGADLLVAATGGDVQGFYLARTVAEQGEIFKLGVRRDCRRRGIGRALLEAGLELGRRRNWSECFLEVRSENHAALELYRRMGFREVGRRSRYYADPPGDALILALPCGRPAREEA